LRFLRCLSAPYRFLLTARFPVHWQRDGLLEAIPIENRDEGVEMEDVVRVLSTLALMGAVRGLAGRY
jgi:hypothetical protein